MRQTWERDRPELELDRAAVARLLEPIFPGAAIARVERVGGGLVNTNLKLEFADRSAPVLLRIYQRSGEHGAKEAALIRGFAGGVPIPELIHFAADNPVTGHPYSVLSWVEGRPLDALDTDTLAGAGGSLGAALARIHAKKFPRFGFLGGDLAIVHPIDLDRRGLLTYLDHSFASGEGAARLGPELLAQLRDFIERAGDEICAWPGAPCLVHGDCNASNLIFREGRTGCELAAILDWEFAFSGTPGFDFAHFLRPPLAARPAFAEAVAASYREAGGALPPDWPRIARITDLFAWIDIVSRPDAGPNVVADARQHIARTMAQDPAER